MANKLTKELAHEAADQIIEKEIKAVFKKYALHAIDDEKEHHDLFDKIPPEALAMLICANAMYVMKMTLEISGAPDRLKAKSFETLCEIAAQSCDQEITNITRNAEQVH
jgi:hypothetical protein